MEVRKRRGEGMGRFGVSQTGPLVSQIRAYGGRWEGQIGEDGQRSALGMSNRSVVGESLDGSSI